MQHTADERINTLETKLTFQEDTITALNNALIKQQTRIDQLELMLKMMVSEMDELKDAQVGTPKEPPPPHY